MLKSQNEANAHLSPEQQKEILLLAERLQSERTHHATLDELSKAASEAGIAPNYIEEAYALLHREVASKPKREPRSDLPQLTTAAALTLMHLFLYQIYPSVFDRPLGVLIVGLGVVFGFLNARSWTRNALALLAGPAITLGTFLLAVLISKLSTSVFSEVQWIPAKEILYYLSGAILVGIVAGRVWGEVKSGNQQGKTVLPEP